MLIFGSSIEGSVSWVVVGTEGEVEIANNNLKKTDWMMHKTIELMMLSMLVQRRLKDGQDEGNDVADAA